MLPLKHIVQPQSTQNSLTFAFRKRGKNEIKDVESQLHTQEFFQGGSTNSFEDSGQRERGSVGSCP
jgi:hypothetical protein